MLKWITSREGHGREDSHFSSCVSNVCFMEKTHFNINQEVVMALYNSQFLETIL